MSDLPNLPPSTDEYWEEADTNLREERPSTKCEHLFVYSGSGEVECIKCHVGYLMSPGWKVIEGHLHDDQDNFVI